MEIDEIRALTKDTQWHNNIQMVKRMIKEGADPASEIAKNTAEDHWHPEIALLWEIAKVQCEICLTSKRE